MTDPRMWLILSFVALLALFWIGDYARRRRRARRMVAASRARMTQVNVADVIERETEDVPWREELLAQQPAHVRVPEQWRYELVWCMIPPGSRAGSFLDAGCGDGYVLQETRAHLPERFVRWYGADISDYKAARAHERLGARAAIAVANVEQLPYRDANFDVILSTEVLEHLLRVEPGIAELCRICRPGGRVLLSTPSRHCVFISFANPLTWLEAAASLYVPQVLPPFHNLERPNDPHSVVHRAFTRQELRAGFSAFQSVSIRSCQYRLPGPLYRWIRSPQTLLRVEQFLARIPLVKHLGETLIVCAVK